MKQEYHFNFTKKIAFQDKERENNFDFSKKKIQPIKSTYRIFKCLSVISIFLIGLQSLYLIDRFSMATAPIYTTQNEMDITYLIQNNLHEAFEKIKIIKDKKQLKTEKERISSNIKNMMIYTQSARSMMILEDTIHSTSMVDKSLHQQVKLEINQRIKKQYEEIIIDMKNKKSSPLFFFTHLIPDSTYQHLTKIRLMKNYGKQWLYVNDNYSLSSNNLGLWPQLDHLENNMLEKYSVEYEIELKKMEEGKNSQFDVIFNNQ